MNSPSLALGADHAGWQLKNHLVQWLQQQGHTVTDYGVNGPASVDYPDLAATVGRAVAAGTQTLGILVCGSGIGVSIAANKVPGVRAAHCHDPISARLSREHNDANVLTLGERLVTPLVAEEIVSAWLEAQFAGGRHQQRVAKITALEASHATQLD
ncbi:MAG: ribose 5-phosphate isomerase B [Candidatus Sericytochromatia bacterium]